MELREYLHILRRRRWIMLGVFVTVVATAVLGSLRTTPIYRSETRVEVQPVISGASSDMVQFLETLFDRGRGLDTQVELIRSEAVLKQAAKNLGLPSPAELESALGVELVGETSILKIWVEHERPEEARDWAAAVAQAYIEFRRQRAIDQVLLASEDISRRIEQVKASIAEKDVVLADLEGAAEAARDERDRLTAELAGLDARVRAPGPSPAPASRSLINKIQQTRLRIAELDRQIQDYETGGSGPKAERDTLVARRGALEAQLQGLPDAEALRRGGGTIIAPAKTPTTPVRPNIARNVALAVAMGIALAVGFAFLAEQLDDRVRTPEEVEQRVGAPVLGYIPFAEDWTRHPRPFLVSVDEPTSGPAEAYRTLRTNLRFLSLERPLRTILVTSAVAEEGKTTTAANLAVAFAQSGTRTVLLSGDLRRPDAHKLFGLPDAEGLMQSLNPGIPLDVALQPIPDVENFRLLSSGGLPPNPTETLASSHFARLLESLADAADLVLIDSPPVLGLADAGVLASRVDGVLLVVDTHHVTRRALSHGAEQLRKAGGRIVGSVVNAVQPEEGYGYYYQYYYYRYSQDGRGKTEERAPAGVSGAEAESEPR